MTLGLAVPDDAEVIRFSKFRTDYISSTTRLPTWKTWNPSTNEKKTPPVRISVWDSGKTAVAQARTLAQKPDDPAFALAVKQVQAVSVRVGVEMPVKYEPLTEPTSMEPGAAGHAAILNTYRVDGESKVDWKARLDQLGGKSGCRRLE